MYVAFFRWDNCNCSDMIVPPSEENDWTGTFVKNQEETNAMRRRWIELFGWIQPIFIHKPHRETIQIGVELFGISYEIFFDYGLPYDMRHNNEDSL